MAEYEVSIAEVVWHTTTVTAESRDEAYDKAWEIIANASGEEYDTEAEGFTGDYKIYEVK